MKQVFLFVLAFFACASGGPVDLSLDSGKCDPVFNVIGNHYAPRAVCNKDPMKLKEKQYNIVKKYLMLIDGHEDLGRRKELMAILHNLSTTNVQLLDQPDLRCSACTAGLKLIKYMQESNYTNDQILDIAYTLCVDLNILYPHMCKGLINVYGDAATEVLQKSPFDSEVSCAILFNGVCYESAHDKIMWNVILPSKPKPLLNNLVENPGKPKLKVLHISDTHWDLEYREDMPSDCRSVLCCREDSMAYADTNERSGKWGGWKCDIPEVTFDSFLEHVRQEHKDIDYILWTGDIPAHDLWKQNVESNYNILDRTITKLKKAFPNIPIYPALGNHESVPPNLFPTKTHSGENILDWLYSKLNQEWQQWLPEGNSNTILRGGFFSVLAKPDLRIISMNMNYCYSMNWWLLVDAMDPEMELKWLVDILAQAEENNEKVHIIGHIPSGFNDCVKVWQKNFYKIINRFENTVTAQFFGHTHYDEFEIFYDMEDTNRPFGIAYVAPSLTTYTYLNPGYRIYYVDGDYRGSTRYVLDHETWIMDLEKSNAKGKAVWYKLYSAKEAYNMTSLFPGDWHNVYEKMKEDDHVMDLYLRYYWKNSPKQSFCDENCKLERFCDIRSCVQYGQPNNVTVI